jgi:hypothetical protein
VQAVAQAPASSPQSVSGQRAAAGSSARQGVQGATSPTAPSTAVAVAPRAVVGQRKRSVKQPGTVTAAVEVGEEKFMPRRQPVQQQQVQRDDDNHVDTARLLSPASASGQYKGSPRVADVNTAAAAVSSARDAFPVRAVEAVSPMRSPSAASPVPREPRDERHVGRRSHTPLEPPRDRGRLATVTPGEPRRSSSRGTAAGRLTPNPYARPGSRTAQSRAQLPPDVFQRISNMK